MPDLLFHNGTILFDFQKPAKTGQALLVKSGKIAAVGMFKSLEKGNSDAQKIDLAGRVLAPAFIDCHVHIWKIGDLLTRTLDLRGAASLDEMLEKLRVFAQNHPENAWILARGFNEALWPNAKMPTREDLDQAVSDRPLVVQRTCAHITVVNSGAIDFCFLNQKSEASDGIFREQNQGFVFSKIPPLTDSELEEMIDAAQNLLLEKGIATATDPACDPQLLRVYEKMEAENRLKIRVRAFPIRLPDGSDQPFPLPAQKINPPYLKIDTVKFFADGGLSGKTAALFRPYLNSNDRGIMRLQNPEFFDLLNESIQNGWNAAIHAIGDEAIDFILENYRKIRKTTIGEHKKLRIEHLGLPTEKHLDDIKKLGIEIATQPIFIEELGPNFSKYLDADYLEKVYPVRSLLDRKIAVGFSSDAPVVKNFDPLFGIVSAVKRRSKTGEILAEKEAISIAEAFDCYTRGAARLNGDEQEMGSLEVGKWADLVVFDRNPLVLDADEISKIRILETWVGGVRRS